LILLTLVVWVKSSRKTSNAFRAVDPCSQILLHARGLVLREEPLRERLLQEWPQDHEVAAQKRQQRQGIKELLATLAADLDPAQHPQVPVEYGQDEGHRSAEAFRGTLDYGPAHDGVAEALGKEKHGARTDGAEEPVVDHQ
jgi:hypothetical protein